MYVLRPLYGVGTHVASIQPTPVTFLASLVQSKRRPTNERSAASQPIIGYSTHGRLALPWTHTVVYLHDITL